MPTDINQLVLDVREVVTAIANDQDTQDTAIENIAERATFLEGLIPFGGVSLPGLRSLAEISPQVSNAVFTDLVEQILNEAAALKQKVLVPPALTGRLTRSVLVNGMVSIFGFVGLSTLRTVPGGLNAPLIQINITEHIVLPLYAIEGVMLYNDIPSQLNAASCGIYLTGDVLLTYVNFTKVRSIGCFATIKNGTGTFPSPFGEESQLNNCSFDEIWPFYHPNAINARYAVWHTRGSGTGNTYKNFKGNAASRGRQVATVTLANQGSGYTLPPTVTVSSGLSSLQLQAVLGTGGDAGKVVALNILAGGYAQETDTLVFTNQPADVTGSGGAATFTLVTKIILEEDPAHIRIDGGPGVVCGDIVADGSITSLASCHVSVDGTMEYLAAIRVGDMSQTDAAATGAIRYVPQAPGSSYGQTLRGIVGGEVDITAGFNRLQGSIVEHQGIGQQDGGVSRQGLGAGAVVEILRLKNIREYTGAEVRIVASGLIQSVGGGVAVKTFLISQQDAASDPVAVLLQEGVAPVAFAGIAITATVSGDDLRFIATLSSPIGGSDVDIQFRVTGGSLNTRRGH